MQKKAANVLGWFASLDKSQQSKDTAIPAGTIPLLVAPSRSDQPHVRVAAAVALGPFKAVS